MAACSLEPTRTPGSVRIMKSHELSCVVRSGRHQRPSWAPRVCAEGELEEAVYKELAQLESDLARSLELVDMAVNKQQVWKDGGSCPPMCLRTEYRRHHGRRGQRALRMRPS